jgi:hypothetical protein
MPFKLIAARATTLNQTGSHLKKTTGFIACLIRFSQDYVSVQCPYANPSITAVHFT